MTALGGDPTVFPNGVNAGSLMVTDQLIVDGVDITDAVDAVSGMTASAAELNYNDTAVAGTAVPSKTAVLGAQKNLDELHLAALYMGAGAGTLLTPTAAQINKLAGLAVNDYLVFQQMISFTETTGAGVYTGTIVIPAGGFVGDVFWHNTALWTATTSATLKVGTADDDDMIFTAIDLKSAPIADVNGAGGISFAKNDTGSGVAGGKTLYFPAGKSIVAVVTTVGGAGNAGRSVMLVRYAVPTAVVAGKA